VPQTRISEIVHGRRAISTDTGLRLSRALGTDERFWINLQTDYDIEIANEQSGAALNEVRPLVSA